MALLTRHRMNQTSGKLWIALLVVFVFACQLMPFAHAQKFNSPVNIQSNIGELTGHTQDHQSSKKLQLQAHNNHVSDCCDDDLAAMDNCCDSGSACNQDAKVGSTIDIKQPIPFTVFIPFEELLVDGRNILLDKTIDNSEKYYLYRPRRHLLNCTLLN